VRGSRKNIAVALFFLSPFFIKGQQFFPDQYMHVSFSCFGFFNDFFLCCFLFRVFSRVVDCFLFLFSPFPWFSGISPPFFLDSRPPPLR